MSDTVRLRCAVLDCPNGLRVDPSARGEPPGRGLDLSRPSPTGATPMTPYSVPCPICGAPVPTMTERRQARLCGGDKCRGAKEADL